MKLRLNKRDAQQFIALNQSIIIEEMDHIIIEVGADREESDGYAQLDQQFFLDLHQTEVRLIKLKHGRKSKQSQRQINTLIMHLVSGYTECIDYFGSFGDAAVAYFQIKIKELNKYYQFLNNQAAQNPLAQAPNIPQMETKKDLGSISDQTGTELLPEQQRSQVSLARKETLNHHLMLSLQDQDIGSHIKQSMKKQKKINNAITDSLKQQDDFLMKRKKGRKGLNKSRAFHSFSQNALDFSQSIEPSETSELMFTDLEALQANSPQQLRAFAQKLTIQIKGASENDGAALRV